MPLKQRDVGDGVGHQAAEFGATGRKRNRQLASELRVVR